MKRVVFVNLHTNGLILRTVTDFIFKRKSCLKHKYLLDFLLSNSDFEVCNYINQNGFSLVRSAPDSLQRIVSFFAQLEACFTMRLNNIHYDKIHVIKNSGDIQIDDIVIGYRILPLSDMSEMHAFKAVGMIHFHGECQDSDMIRKAEPNIVFNESDLRKYSDIFKKYYSWYQGDFIIHPFVAADRFKCFKTFAERENRCFSTGTITYKCHDEFLDVYGDSCDQPVRKQILANEKELEPWIACYNSEYLEDIDMKKCLPSDSRLTHYRKVWYNNTHIGKQKKYFSFDMVERFNNFKMCLVGEEILGVPGIGFVEGMACGCAYIGQTIGYYEDYGMQEGVHYIGYDGTLEDLKAKISYYQQPEHQEELERIANAGYEFAQTHFRGDAVAKELLDKLIMAQQEWKASI